MAHNKQLCAGLYTEKVQKAKGKITTQKLKVFIGAF
jgi:hypothetical protein